MEEAIVPNQDELLAELAYLVNRLDDKLEHNKLEHYRPYPRQVDFHNLLKRERLFMAGNQLGKTYSGGMEAAVHATGLYPDWWQGYRFDRPTVGWVLGLSGEFTRDNAQKILMGRGRQYGTGTIPGMRIKDAQLARGVADLLDYVVVEHVPTGKLSTIYLKAYDKGRERLQGETIDWAWCDEEPPEDIYNEVLTRLNVALGPLWITFTPLKGMSSVVSRFLHPNDDDLARDNRGVVTMTIDDVDHYDAETKAIVVSGYAEHEREARAKGVPLLGSGRIFPVPEEAIRFDLSDFPNGFPAYWPGLGALDFGDWDHPTAGVFLRWDRDTDTVYVYDCYRARKQPLGAHASAILARGKWPIAWPHDGLKATNQDGTAGVKIKDLYARHGLKMLPEHAQFEDGNWSVEAGIVEMLERMQTGRFKVAAHLPDWWEEFRMYHRKDGLIVKERDDLMAASRYGIMCLRFARRPNTGAHGIQVENMEDYHALA